MRRFINRFFEELNEKNKYLFFGIILLICFFSIFISIYFEFYYKYSDSDPLMIGINKNDLVTDEEIENLKLNFNNMFQNNVKINSLNIESIEKSNIQEDVVFTKFIFKDEVEKYYSVNVQIPEINLNSEISNNINKEIKDLYYEKMNEIINQRENKIMYTVSYCAFLNNNILSLVIKSTYKEQENPEQVSIKTYNLELQTNQSVSLENLIELKEKSKNWTQSLINSTIKAEYNATLQIPEEYREVYERDLNSSSYLIENSNEYFLTDSGYVYIIYAYGNYDYTNEMDIIVF